MPPTASTICWGPWSRSSAWLQSAALGVGLALLQGPFIALLGMVGGFLTSALIESQTPSAFALFGYLIALVAGSLAVVRYKPGGGSPGQRSPAARYGSCYGS